MPSKLGPHCLRVSNGARQLIDAGCRIVKLVDDFGLGPELANRPGVTLIGRVVASSPRTAEEQQKGSERPEAAARRFIASQKEKYMLNPTIKIWEGHNEPSFGSMEEMSWYAQFDIARLKMLADMGLRGVIGCFATGSPGDIHLWKAYVPAVQAAKQYNGILGLHEYSSPWLWWMTGRYQLKDEDEGDTGWVTLRYRKVMRQFLAPAGCADVPIAITEFGLDRIGYVPNGASSGNWRTNAEWWSNWDGSKDPIDYWRGPERKAERYYAEQLIWYDKEIRKDPNVLGATIYTLGYLDAAWKDYDIDGTDVVKVLVDYIRREANVPDAVGAAAPRPSVLSVVTAAGATTGVNLLRNPGFENGYTHWRNIPELAIPNEWEFWYLEDFKTRLPNQDHDFLKPETVVWNINDAPLEERKTFFLSGDFCLKVFKGWGPVWFKFSQKVSGLTPGGRYRFTVPIHPDLVMKYDVVKGKIYADDPLAGEHRLIARSGGQETATDWLNGAQVPFGKYTDVALDFTANDSQAEVICEARGRWGLVNNGWFFGSPSLVAVSAPEVTPVAVTQPTPQAVPSVSPSGGNLLQNPNFDGGVYQLNPLVRHLEAPNGWQFWSADEQTARVSKQPEPFRAPKAGVVSPTTAAPDDRDGLVGGLPRAYRVVGNWRAIWFSLSQTLRALQAGRRYRFSVQLMPNPVDKYLAGGAKQFVADPDGGEVWLKAVTGGQKTEIYKRVGADFQPGGYLTFTHDFTAAQGDTTVTVEVRARYPLTHNAWYIASASLQAI